ncbi:MAG: class I SAM-dependent methyltransferase [Chloroflexi bacterium]|nr:class I SAM-dependent methyltransferase [Chloroflexota bacterium]
MNRWKFFDITHRDHLICNPLSSEKLDEIVTLLDLPRGARVLDIACGKAELLVRLVERYGARGDGVDLSPYAVRDARTRAEARVPGSALVFHEMDGRDFQAGPGSYDLAICLGASWVFDGHRGTLEALRRVVHPGGLVLVGEPYWRRTPDPEDLRTADYDAAAFATHAGNVAIGLELGLTCLYSIVSSEDDWDRYQGLQWRAAERYATAHPDDPDVAELLQRQRAGRDAYLRWERDTLGWAVYLFRSDGHDLTPS